MNAGGDGTTDYSALHWAAKAAATAAAIGDLDSLSDVTVTTPATKHALMHNGAGQFVNRVLVEADISDLQSYSLDSHTHAFSALTSKPTTIAGYGITDAYTKSQIDTTFGNYTLTSGLSISNWNTAYGWGDHGSGGYADLAGSSSQIFYADTLVLSNKELADIATTGEVGYDANDADGDMATLGTFTSSPIGMYVWDGVQEAKLWHSQHFTGTHVANWQTAYGWGDHSATYEPLDATLVRDDDAGYNKTEWDTAYGWGDHASGGYMSDLVDDTTPQLGGNLDMNSKWITNIKATAESRNGGLIDDIDTAGEGGLYRWAGTQPTDSSPGWTYSALMAVHDGGQTIQMAFGGSGYGRLSIRRKDSGTWYGWTSFWSDNDFSSTDVSNWGTAYGWGDHASGGYAAETGPTGDWLIDANYGHSVVGLYSATKYQGVFAMGSSYTVTDNGTTLGTLYGLAWTHTNNTEGQAKAGLSHQLLVVENGITKVAIGSGIWCNYVIDAQDFNAIGYGAAGTPTFATAVDTDTGMYGESSNVLAFSTGGVRRLQLYNSGGFFSVPLKVDSLGVAAWNTAGQSGCEMTISTSAASGGSNGDIHFKY